MTPKAQTINAHVSACHAHVKTRLSKSHFFGIVYLCLWVSSAHFSSAFSIPLGSSFVAFTFGLIILASMTVYWPLPKHIALSAIIAYLFLLALSSATFPILSGPDERHFFNSLLAHSTEELLSRATASIRSLENLIAGGTVTVISSSETFPLKLSLFLPHEGSLQPRAIVAANSFLWIIACYYFSWAVSRNYTPPSRSSLQATLLCFLLLSPTAIYWSGTFAKEIATTSTIMLAAVAFTNRKYVLGAVLSTIALSLSAVAVAFIPTLYALTTKNRRMLYLIAASGLVALFSISQSAGAVANVLPMTLYTLLSPSPLNAENYALVATGSSWEPHPRGFFLAEAFFVSTVTLAGAALMLLHKSARGIFGMIFAALLIAGTTWSLRGAITLDDYGFLSTGGNFVRYKFGAWPIVGLVFTLTLHQLLDSVRLQARKLHNHGSRVG